MILVQMYYDKNAIATVLAISDVLNLEGTLIKYYSTKQITIFVTYQVVEYDFNEHSNRLYFYKYNKIMNGYNNIQTVTTNKKK